MSHTQRTETHGNGRCACRGTMTGEKAAKKPERPLAADHGVQDKFRPRGRGRNQQRDGPLVFRKASCPGARKNLFTAMAAACPAPAAHQRGPRENTLSVEVLRMLRQLRISAKWKGHPTRRAKRSTDRFRTGCKSNPVASKNVERANRALAAKARAAKKRRKRACEGAPTRFGPPAEGITTRRKDHDTPRQSPSPTCRV